MKNNLIGLTIGAAVAIIVLASALAPVIKDTTTASVEFKNEGVYHMTDAEPFSISVDRIEGIVTANEEQIPFDAFPSGSWTICYTDSFILRFTTDNAWFINSSGTIRSLYADASTFVFNNGSLTSNDVEIATYSPGTFRGITTDESAPYVMTSGTDTIHLNEDSTIVMGGGSTRIANWYDPFFISGTCENMTVFGYSPDYSVSDVQVNYSPVSGFDELVTFDSVTFKASSEDTSVDATYNRVIVPATVLGEKSEYVGDAAAAIIGAIPILVITAVILGVASVALRGSRD